MVAADEFSESYRDLLDGIYDCVDRIVINAYFIMSQTGGGFRTWWRRLMGNDDNLDNTHLMRLAGRFARRVQAYAKKNGIPLIKCQRGERVLRIEAVAHNTKELRCKRGIDNFPTIIASLKEILDRFLTVLRGVDICFIDSGTLDEWPHPSQVGAVRVCGLDVNKPRIRAVMKAVIALSTNPRGFTASELAEKVREITGLPEKEYRTRHASYDLKKLRGKGLVNLSENSRRYQVPLEGLRSMSAFLVLREKVLQPLLSCSGKRKRGPKPINRSEIDLHYENIQIEMQKIFNSSAWQRKYRQFFVDVGAVSA